MCWKTAAAAAKSRQLCPTLCVAVHIFNMNKNYFQYEQDIYGEFFILSKAHTGYYLRGLLSFLTHVTFDRTVLFPTCTVLSMGTFDLHFE